MLKKQNTNKLLSQKEKSCFYCVHSIRDIDYKDSDSLIRFTSSYAKILPRKRTGACSKHQRKISSAIKRARFMALFPYTNR